MDLILNNVKGLGIHLLMSIVSILFVLLYIIGSPLYSSQIMAVIMVALLYIAYLLIYLKLSHCLKLETNKKHDYMVGILAFLSGVVIWGVSIYYSGCAMNDISESVAEYWMPYNAYIFPSWLFVYGQENPLILLLGSLSPVVLLSAGMKIKRYKFQLNK